MSKNGIEFFHLIKFLELVLLPLQDCCDYTTDIYISTYAYSWSQQNDFCQIITKLPAR